MSFKEKNIVVTLANFTLIETFFLIRVLVMLQSDSFTQKNVFQLFGVVVFFAIVVSLIGIILANFGATIWESIRTGEKDPDFEYIEDERDKMIDLKGTQTTYTVASLGSFVAMLAFMYGSSALVMFCLLIFTGVLAQISGDIRRLALYRRGF